MILLGVSLPDFAASLQYTATARAQTKCPLRCTAITSSNCSSVIEKLIASRRIPALLIRICTSPNESTAAATRSSPVSHLATSPRTLIASPPESRISSAVDSALLPRSFTTIFAPSEASNRACSLPTPLPPPVTIATFPSKRPMNFSNSLKS